MREELRKYEGQRLTYTAKVEKYGIKHQPFGYRPKKTVLLTEVKCVTNKNIQTDHLWMIVGKKIETLNLKEGDIVQFDARVKQYYKGYKGRVDEDYWDKPPVEKDYRLSTPSKVKLVKRAEDKKEEGLDKFTENEVE